MANFTLLLCRHFLPWILDNLPLVQSEEPFSAQGAQPHRPRQHNYPHMGIVNLCELLPLLLSKILVLLLHWTFDPYVRLCIYSLDARLDLHAQVQKTQRQHVRYSRAARSTRGRPRHHKRVKKLLIFSLFFTNPADPYKYPTWDVLKWMLLMGATYIVGCQFYIFRFPEKFIPGKFDIWVKLKPLTLSLTATPFGMDLCLQLR